MPMTTSDLSAAMVTLVSSEGQQIEASSHVLRFSNFITSTVEDTGTDSPIPLPIVNTWALGKVVEWCQHITEHPLAEEDEKKLKNCMYNDFIPEWHKEFVEALTIKEKIDLVLAANYLEIPLILKFLCRGIANMIRGKTPTEICGSFGIEEGPETTEEEKVAVYKAFPWSDPAQQEEKVEGGPVVAATS